MVAAGLFPRPSQYIFELCNTSVAQLRAGSRAGSVVQLCVFVFGLQLLTQLCRGHGMAGSAVVFWYRFSVSVPLREDLVRFLFVFCFFFESVFISRFQQREGKAKQ